MGDQARLRRNRRIHPPPPPAPMRVVPSRRGLAVVFTLTGAAGATVGAVVEHLLRWHLC